MDGSEGSPDQRNQVASGLHPRLAEDRFYSALAATDRRRLLYFLCENEESTIAELASVLSGWELTPTGTMQTPEERSRIRLQLLHSHLPRLADADLLSYDADSGTVQLAPLHPRVRDLIRQSVEAEQLAGSG